MEPNFTNLKSNETERNAILNAINSTCNAFSVCNDSDQLQPVDKCKSIVNQLQTDLYTLLESLSNRAKCHPSIQRKRNSNSKNIDYYNKEISNIHDAFKTTCMKLENHLKFMILMNDELLFARRNVQLNSTVDNLNKDGAARSNIVSQIRRYADNVDELRRVLGQLTGMMSGGDMTTISTTTDQQQFNNSSTAFNLS
ncbi:hypothetical protein GJ496_001507 [Pomphorhynchus laevis]|nr:hypothetical protein GJ496_001507 [Pomphorhynchus laevis]